MNDPAIMNNEQVNELRRKIVKEKIDMDNKIRSAIFCALDDFKRSTGLSVTAIDVNFLEIREYGFPRGEYILETVNTTINLGI